VSDEWRTPQWLYSLFAGWDDPALPLRTDGLTRAWGPRTYCNPPYSRPGPWVAKAISEARLGKLIVMLLQNDSSTRWWAALHEAGAHFLYIGERLHYSEAGPARFASVLVILEGRHPAPVVAVGLEEFG